MSLLRALLEGLVEDLSNPYVIKDRAGSSKYLSRWYLYNGPVMPDGSDPHTGEGEPREGLVDVDRPFAVFLHKFHRGDDEPELHNHPWKWALALVLVGGYEEERAYAIPPRLHPDYGDEDEDRPRRMSAITKGFVAPGTVNLLTAETFHRVDLREKDAWSLFLAGPRTGSSWGFWNRVTDVFLPWKEFIRAKRRKKDAA